MKLLSDEPAVQQARAHSGRIVRALNDLAALVQVAWDKRYDRVLKYHSWQDYCTGEFGSGETAIRARQIVTVMLRGENLTEKAIAAEIGVSQPTVNRDLSEQGSYAPARGGRTGDQRRARRREQYRQPPAAEGAVERLARLMARVPADRWIWAAEPATVADDVNRWTYRASPVTAVPAAAGSQTAIPQQPAAIAEQPAEEPQSAANVGQPATQPQPAANQDQPAIGGQPAALPPAAGTLPWERLLQGDTDGARAEIRRRVLAGLPVRRDQIAAQFGVSEMFARQATAVEEEAALRQTLITDALTGDTAGNCARELTAVRDRYPGVLGASPWLADCLQLIIDTLSEQE